MGTIIFYLIGIMILFFGVMTVIAQQIFRSAIYLLFCLINVAALYFFLDFEFIAAVQVSVYVGGIVVLILFALFLTHHVDHKLPVYPIGRLIAAALAGVFGFALTCNALFHFGFPLVNDKPNEFTIHRIGRLLLDYNDGGFILPFEAVSVLLLASMIGCIAIALQTKNPAEIATTESTTTNS